MTVLIPVQQGTNLVRLGVADTGDHILDSGLVVSNLRALSGTASTGVKLEIVAPTTGGTVSSSAPTQAIAEIFYGSTFNDVVIACAGDDYANSSGGNDWFDMGDGNDHAIGGSWNDTFEGGNGNDILEGGAGNDTFSGTISQFNGDTINDFGSNDTLQFSGALLTSSNFTFSTSSAASASSSAALASSGQTSVAVDTNKDGTADASFVLKGSFNPALFTVSSPNPKSSWAPVATALPSPAVVQRWWAIPQATPSPLPRVSPASRPMPTSNASALAATWPTTRLALWRAPACRC
ncbi:MAG: hypothetical protein IPH37_15565 [Burkholderiales bacterium]|nr:hypothetical protein [Burkholderiales bacterium]